jgi:hypothetical protein
MDAINGMLLVVQVVDAQDQKTRELLCRRLVAELGCSAILNNPLPEWLRQRNG